jgi:hypothetical protein
MARLIFVIAMGVALSGCSGAGYYTPPLASGLTRPDMVGFAPWRPNVKSTKAAKWRDALPETDRESSQRAELAALKPYSKEWWSVSEAIDRAAEVKLSKKLIICRGCIPKTTDDQTASVPYDQHD